MADRLMLAPAIAAVAALLPCIDGAAQALVDPTRPPLELIRAAAGAADAAPGGAEARPRLESILLSSVRKGAIINGAYVPLGGAYGNATLVGITATEVTLKTDQGFDVLQLYPPMDKAAVGSGTGEKPEKVVKRP